MIKRQQKKNMKLKKGDLVLREKATQTHKEYSDPKEWLDFECGLGIVISITKESSTHLLKANIYWQREQKIKNISDQMVLVNTGVIRTNKRKIFSRITEEETYRLWVLTKKTKDSSIIINNNKEKEEELVAIPVGGDGWLIGGGSIMLESVLCSKLK